MLVLSRRVSEKLVLSGLGISIEILKVGRKAVKLGIVAPASVAILRSEVARLGHQQFDDAQPSERHRFRNQVNALSLRLHLIQAHLQRADFAQARAAWEDLLAAIRLAKEETVSVSPETTAIGETDVRLLIVDDNPNERQLLSGLLHLNGFHADTVADGDEALRYLNSGPLPHCILLDINMPRVDGSRVIRSIRSDERYQHIRVFGVTGEGPPLDDDMPDGLRGFDGWFQKPLDPTMLLKAITEIDYSDSVLQSSFSSLITQPAVTPESFHGIC
jgi:carbon storage regulator CsrA